MAALVGAAAGNFLLPAKSPFFLPGFPDAAVRGCRQKTDFLTGAPPPEKMVGAGHAGDAAEWPFGVGHVVCMAG